MADRSRSDSLSLRTNTLWALIGEAVQLIVGAAAFFLLVDRLGPVEAGYYGAVLAIATLGLPLASVGSQALLMRDISAGGDFNTIWSRSIQTVFAGGSVATAAALLSHAWLLPEIPLWSFGLLFGTQAVLHATAEFGLVAAQAHRRLDVGAFVRTVTASCRLGAVLLFSALGQPTVASWSLFSAGGLLIAALASLTVVWRSFGALPRGSGPTVANLKRGLPFALGAGSARALDSVDRPMLVRLSSNSQDAGVYNTGYRLTQLAMTPIAALVRASDADIYAAGVHGRAEAFAVARRLSSRAAVYGVAAGVGLLVLAPVVPAVLGDEWSESASVLRFLAPLPLIKVFQVFPANALTSSGHQGSRNRLLLAAIAMNGTINAFAIPEYGWRGAAISTLAAEAALVVGLWIILLRPAARSR